jgi:predicted nuclease of predicted toxin-antitoxin system
LLDQPLPARLVAFFERYGHEALHVKSVGLAQAADHDVWSFAGSSTTVIVTKDQDYNKLARGGADEPRVLWLRCGNCSNEKLEALLLDHWIRIETWLRTSQQVFQIL